MIRFVFKKILLKNIYIYVTGGSMEVELHSKGTLETKIDVYGKPFTVPFNFSEVWTKKPV